MLEGKLVYIDKETRDYKGTNKTYKFNLKAAEFPNVIWLALSTDTVS